MPVVLRIIIVYLSFCFFKNIFPVPSVLFILIFGWVGTSSESKMLDMNSSFLEFSLEL